MEEETKECPSCHLLNPVTRVTCQVCHAKMSGKNPFEGGTIAVDSISSPDAYPPKKKRGRKPKIVKERKPRTPKDSSEIEIAPKTYVSVSKSPTKEVPSEKPTRKKRQRKPKSFPIQYFALVGNVLLPISISIQMKPMKKKDVEGGGQNLITLWNRNKSLLS